ncbi:hypothetical protein [Methylocella sp.]|uniref:hypothetical protein n=1 Tax=Methylocella sp. TaxID=1978226 RepID=UPI0037830697
MSEDASILVLGMDELASAVARKLHLAGHAVAIHQPSPPQTIRRRMSFADAWFDGAYAFEGVEARRADKTRDFLASLKSGVAVPILWHAFDDVSTRWPWDIIVDARSDETLPAERLRHLADLTIGLGPRYVAGANCDVLIDIGARDPGGVIRQGPLEGGDSEIDRRFADGRLALAPVHGMFKGQKLIGDGVLIGDVVGVVGATPAIAPCSGRVRGIARDGAAVARGAEICEIVASPNAELTGISRRDRLIARSVAFVVEMERAGFAPISLENYF